MRVSLLLLVVLLSACVMPAKEQNPGVSKRPVRTSSFLGKNDYYIDDAKKEKKQVKKTEDKKEVAAKKPEEKKPGEKKPEEKKEEAAKGSSLREILKEEEEYASSDYPIDRHRRRAFSGYTNVTAEPEEAAHKDDNKESAKDDDKGKDEIPEDKAEDKEPEQPLYEEEGLASWYGPGFHGRQTANGEKFNQDAMTAAHRKYPMGTKLEVTNLDNGKTVTVRVNDRGPYSGKRIIDLSKAAAKKLDIISHGVAHVGIKEVEE